MPFVVSSVQARSLNDPSSPGYVSLSKALLLGLWTETLLYGVSLILYIACVWVIIYKRPNPRINWLMLVTTAVLFVLSTIHVAIDLSRNIIAFTSSGDSEKYFGQLNNPLHLFKTAVFATETYVADALLVYRLFVVWERNIWISILPCLLVLSTAVVGYGVTYELTKLGDNIFIEEFTHWVLSFFSITLVTNVLCTLLISYRIWRAQRALMSVDMEKNSSLTAVIQIIVESGALYSTTLVIMIIVYLLQSNAQYIVLDPITPIIGIVFSMIIIRVALGISHGGNNQDKSIVVARPRDPRLTTTIAQSNGDFTKASSHPMTPLSVTVTRGVITHSDRDADQIETGDDFSRGSMYSSHDDLKAPPQAL